jgi:hypothetical protein
MKWELSKEKLHSDPTRTCYRVNQDSIMVDTIYDAVDDEDALNRFEGFIDAFNRRPQPVILATIEQ